jgi:hypothetical protein
MKIQWLILSYNSIPIIEMIRDNIVNLLSNGTLAALGCEAATTVI